MGDEPTYKERYEAARAEYAKATPRRRRYDICQALNLTRFSIELERLERVGVAKEVTERWKQRALNLLQDVLDVADIPDDLPKNPHAVERRNREREETWGRGTNSS